MKLPEKKHFSLSEVADTLKCTTGDLLHYGATGMLKIAAYLNLSGIKIHGFTSDRKIESGYDGLYYLTTHDLEQLEFGEKEICISMFFPIAPHLPIAKLKTISPDGDESSKEMPYYTIEIDQEGFSVSIDTLVVIHQDLKEFLKGCSDQAAVINCGTKPESKKEINNGGRPDGTLTEVVKHAYKTLQNKDEAWRLQDGNIREFIKFLKLMVTIGNPNADKYVMERIESVKIPASGDCTIKTHERRDLLEKGKSAGLSRSYNNSHITRILMRLRLGDKITT